ncbi:hypothetical protein DNTS_032852 [Danionella cerebrum]|uniref:Transforming acidic coiled-coil-containing protein C-terminal domain-containing protein n=1 Tax=Danionella cerebrum TaxID=2873325 RepID=A0A553QTV2_9TELE|nr:hypothetical protein DNTS_032852 [Danionella translucida]
MSFEVLKENLGVVRMNSDSETACDFFTLDQPTGRPSILRQSQADNINKTANRTSKVCFQTPRRDPVTKRIMSPSRTSHVAIQENLNNSMEFQTSNNKSPETSSIIPVDMEGNNASYPDDEMPIQTAGAYTLDFNNLDAINPFLGSNKMANSPPKSSPFPEPVELAPVRSDTTDGSDSPFQTEIPEVNPAFEETLPFIPSVENSLAECSADISSAEGTVILKMENTEDKILDTEDVDVSYPDPVAQQTLVLEDQPEVPLPPKGSYNLDFDNLEMLNPFQTGGSKIPNSPTVEVLPVSDLPVPCQEAQTESVLPVKTLDFQAFPDASLQHQESSLVTETSSSTGPKVNQMVLEFNFDDCSEVKRKPPPKNLGVKRGVKPVTKKTKAQESEKNPESEQQSLKSQEETEPIVAKSLYTLDFDKMDDPNFNPFGTKPEETDPITSSNSTISLNPVVAEPDLMAAVEPNVEIVNQTCELGLMPSEDEFVPGAMFMPGEAFDGQIDYLEQFGSSNFKESALRKQSLYLKFDPLLKESPKKNGVEGEVKRRSECEHVELLADLTPTIPVDQTFEPVVPDATVMDLLVPALKQPAKMEDTIIEVLKYSQRDMDAALLNAERQSEERHQELMKKIEKQEMEIQHLLFIAAEFETTITQITEEQKQNEEKAKIQLEQVLQEKEQLSREFNEMDRSFSSLVKRLDRCKEVIEGFKKNEETLKQYAQNCKERLEKEEKRYQALKAHAEEKLDQANKSIADIRTKQGVELATLQTQLKREQLKVQSLEKELEQKAKEVKDVTELCDDLLQKVQKHGF